ncbi:COX assembly mitochondrial protein homolog [Panthera onca]
MNSLGKQQVQQPRSGSTSVMLMEEQSGKYVWLSEDKSNGVKISKRKMNQALKRKTCWAETHFPNPARLWLLFLPTDQAEAAAGEEGLQRSAPSEAPSLRDSPPPRHTRPRPLPGHSLGEVRSRLRGGARRAQAQCAAEVATREIRRKERGLPAGLRKGHCAPPPWLPPPQGSSGRPHVPPCPGSSPSLPLPGSGRGLLSSPPAEMALDPAEQHLRHVEKDVLIPKIMREKARERCSEQVQDFTKCCKDSGILMVVKCRKENSALKECLTAHYNDPAFYEECKMEYLKEREEFRKTGIPTKKRLQKLPTSM